MEFTVITLLWYNISLLVTLMCVVVGIYFIHLYRHKKKNRLYLFDIVMVVQFVLYL